MLMTSLVARMIADGDIKKQYARSNAYVSMVSYLVRYKNRLWYIQGIDNEIRITCKAYYFKYFSYHDGAICEYEMPTDEYRELAEQYKKNEELMKRRGIKSVKGFIKVVLSLNN